MSDDVAAVRRWLARPIRPEYSKLERQWYVIVGDVPLRDAGGAVRYFINAALAQAAADAVIAQVRQ
jgi:hypothetical protein